MGAARNLESSERFEPTEQQIDSLAQNDNDTKEIIKIGGISNDILEELEKALKEGILNEKEARDLGRKLKLHSASKEHVVQIGEEVKSLISDNQKLIDDFTKSLMSEEDIENKLDVEEQIDRYKKLSTNEKREWFQNLHNVRNNMGFVNKLYDAVAKNNPEMLAEFRKADGHKKKKLGLMSENIGKYEELIKKNSKYFSQESAKEWLTDFKKLTDLQAQDQWIKALEAGKSIQDKKELVDQFEEYPKTYQKQFAKFYKGRKEDRKSTLDEMAEAMKADYLKTFKTDKNSKHFSEVDRKEAEKSWDESPVKVRIMMKDSLPKHMEAAAKLGKEYEDLDKNVQEDLQETRGFSNFYELSFDQKTRTLETAKKIKEGMDKWDATYDTELLRALEKKYIGHETYKKFMDDFKKLDNKTKDQWIKAFKPGNEEFDKRVKITNRFQTELPKKIQDKNSNFYELGYTKRKELLDKLLGEDSADENTESVEGSKLEKLKSLTTKANGLEMDGIFAKDKESKAEKWEEALDLYEEALKIDPENDLVQRNYLHLLAKYKATFPEKAKNLGQDKNGTLSDLDAETAVASAKQGEVMTEHIKRYNLADELADDLKKIEDLNNKKKGALNQTKHLDAKEQTINEALQERTHDKMVVGHDGTAEKVTDIDVTRLNVMETADVFKLKQELVTHRGAEKEKQLTHLQFKKRESGEVQSTELAREQLKKQKSFLQKQIEQRAAQRLKANGKKLTKADEEKIREQAASDNLEMEIKAP